LAQHYNDHITATQGIRLGFPHKNFTKDELFNFKLDSNAIELAFFTSNMGVYSNVFKHEESYVFKKGNKTAYVAKKNDRGLLNNRPAEPITQKIIDGGYLTDLN
jgi:hypothetical protein